MSTETATASQSPAKNPANSSAKVSPQLRAVITIFAADPNLFDVVSPFINYLESTVDWARLSGLVENRTV